MQRLTEQFDRSRRFGKILTFISERLSHYRGVPILIGVVLVPISLVVHIVAQVTGAGGWEIAGDVVLHVAIFIALLGVLLAEPLGKG